MRSGFTLFEVGVSLLIMTVAVTTALMLLPTAVQSQQMTRYQMLAAAKALSLAVSMGARVATMNTTNWNEGETLADGANVNAGYRMPDLHQFANSFEDGVGCTLPMEIARRLDSTNDEITHILDEGGQIYYCPAFHVNSYEIAGDATLAEPTDAATRRLVFAFRGDAQQNVLITHPQTSWPYHAAQPSPDAPWEAKIWLDASIPVPGPGDYAATTSILSGLGFSLPLSTTPPTEAAVLTQATALVSANQLAVACVALRNHAYASLLKATVNPADEPQARADHEWMMRFLIWVQLNLPDECRIPRLANHAVMTDVPLLEYDCFAPPDVVSSYPVRRPSDPTWKCYKVLSERPIAFTRSWSYNNAPATIPGSPRFNATAPFAAAERCRQMVVWAVDWMSYEDAESSPSAAIDSARLSFRPKKGSATVSENQHVGFAQRLAPERATVFVDAARSRTIDWTPGWPWSPPAQYGFESAPPMVYFGRYGADRNFNHAFDIGPTKKSVRLRALTVARFNLYDPRGYVTFR